MSKHFTPGGLIQTNEAGNLCTTMKNALGDFLNTHNPEPDDVIALEVFLVEMVTGRCSAFRFAKRVIQTPGGGRAMKTI